MAAFALTCTAPAEASVVIGGTRVIYRGNDAEVTLKLTNEGKAPALTQAWVDAGNPTASPSAIEVPFTVTPPVARIDPGKGQTLRILYTGEPLPQDKESVFWLNVLEVPPKPTADEAGPNTLQMAFRSRIKLFYRPVGLKGAPNEAPDALHWRLDRDSGPPAVVVSNPTPYHVSLAAIDVDAGGHTVKVADPGMVAPGQTQTFRLSGEPGNPAGATVRFRTINDYGGGSEHSAALAAPSAR